MGTIGSKTGSNARPTYATPCHLTGRRYWPRSALPAHFNFGHQKPKCYINNQTLEWAVDNGRWRVLFGHSAHSLCDKLAASVDRTAMRLRDHLWYRTPTTHNGHIPRSPKRSSVPHMHVHAYTYALAQARTHSCHASSVGGTCVGGTCVGGTCVGRTGVGGAGHVWMGHVWVGHVWMAHVWVGMCVPLLS